MYCGYYNIIILSYLTTFQSLPLNSESSFKVITLYNLTEYEYSKGTLPSIEDFFVSFSYGNIEHLPKNTFEISSIKNLIGIDLSNKSIKNIHNEALSHLYYLQYLNLSKNQFTEINQNMFLALERLKTLNINRNTITYLNKNVFTNLKSIKILDISHNNISELTKASFSNILTLKKLILSHNHIKSIWDPYFDEIINLEELYLDHNEIAMIPIDIFKQNMALKVLDLSSNYLVLLAIGQNSAVLSSIKYLNLSNNYLVNLDVEDIINHFPNNDIIIDINENQFYCSCWREYAKKLKEKNIRIVPGRNSNENYYMNGIACYNLDVTLGQYDPNFQENQVIICKVLKMWF